MIDQLTERFLHHLAARGVDPGELTVPADGSPLLTTAYGGTGRFLSRPVLLDAEPHRRLTADLLRLHDLLVSLPVRLFGGDLDAFCAAVGMTPEQALVVRRTAGPAGPVRLARADLYRDATGFRLLEYNLTSALGGFDNAELTRAALQVPAVKEFAAEQGLAFPDTLAEIAATLWAALESADVPLSDRPVVALTDWPASFPDLERRLGYMARDLAAWGFDATPCHLGMLEHRDGDMFLAGRRVDVVHRFFLIEDVLAGPDATTVMEPVLRAHEAGRTYLFSGLDTEMYGNKRALGLLSDERNRGAFDADELALVDRLLPWTRPLQPGPVDVGGAEVDLVEHVRAQRTGFVLKPSLLHGGIGVVPGWTVSDADWQRALDDALGGPFVVQRRVHPVGEPFPAAGGSTDVFLNWGVFLGVNGYAGAVVRGSTDPEVGVLSMAGGARVAGCLHRPGRAAG